MVITSFGRFGDDIGYQGVQVLGVGCNMNYWPPGPQCPQVLDDIQVFPLDPAREATPGGCYTVGLVGQFINGIGIHSWMDMMSYQAKRVWHNIILEFDRFDMDICLGISTVKGVYHRKYSSMLVASSSNGCYQIIRTARVSRS